MKCSKAEQLISPYIDGETENGEKTLFEAHLRECAACRGKLEDVRRTHALFAHAEHYRAPYGFSTRVMARATTEKERGLPRLLPLVTKFAEVVIVLLMITIGILSGRFLTNSLMGQRTVNIASSFSLDIFEPAPPGSLGGAYLALMEARNEK
jgi:anti-sigma factor RsiW